MIPNENTFQGLSNGSNPNLLSATVMEKVGKNTTKPPVQCHIENYKNPENFIKIQPSVSFLLLPISTTFAAVHFFEAGNAKKLSDLCVTS